MSGPKLSAEEIDRILQQREHARARMDDATAASLLQTLEKHGVLVDTKARQLHIVSEGSSVRDSQIRIVS